MHEHLSRPDIQWNLTDYALERLHEDSAGPIDLWVKAPRLLWWLNSSHGHERHRAWGGWWLFLSDLKTQVQEVLGTTVSSLPGFAHFLWRNWLLCCFLQNLDLHCLQRISPVDNINKLMTVSLDILKFNPALSENNGCLSSDTKRSWDVLRGEERGRSLAESTVKNAFQSRESQNCYLSFTDGNSII